MGRVLCTLPNCSTLVNGDTFAPTENGMLSAELPQEKVDRYLKVPGFQLYQEPVPSGGEGQKEPEKDPENPNPNGDPAGSVATSGEGEGKGRKGKPK